MPGVEWRPSRNFSTNVVRPPYGVVLHIAQGSYEGTIDWQHISSGAQAVSSHFVVAKNGRIAQVVDLDCKAWAESSGNPYWISIEHEGNGGDDLTAAQIEADARIYAFLIQRYDIELTLADTPEQRGLGYHAMGGEAWGGHSSCPGGPIIARRQQILDRARAILEPPATPAPLPIKGSARMLLAPYRLQKDPHNPAYVDVDYDSNPSAIIVHGHAPFKEVPALRDDHVGRYVYTLPGKVTGISYGCNANGTDYKEVCLVSYHGSDRPAHFHWK